MQAEILSLEEGRAELGLRQAWDFPEAWQVGVFEGGLRAFGKKGQVRVCVRSISEVDLELVWSSA